jgi:hypothetical protein
VTWRYVNKQVPTLQNTLPSYLGGEWAKYSTYLTLNMEKLCSWYLFTTLHGIMSQEYAKMNTFCLENKSVKIRTHFCITEYLTTLHPTAFSSHKPLAFYVSTSSTSTSWLWTILVILIQLGLWTQQGPSLQMFVFNSLQFVHSATGVL